MTFRVRFFAEQAYFSFVKESLANPIVDHEKAIERGAVCVVSLNCALEAIANTLLNDHSQTEDWEKQSLHSKLEELLVLAGIAKDWGRHPLQKIKELNSIRNWLVHYKDSDIGLINSDSQWISDELNRHPKRNPDIELTTENIRRLYKAVLLVCLSIAEGLGVAEDFAYMRTETYDAFLVG